MGSCETHPDPAQGLEAQAPARRNPFFEPQAAEGGEAAVLAEYRFISNYEDRFLGRASVVSSREGDLFLCKDLPFSNEQQCASVLRTLLEKKEQQAPVEELLRIKEVLHKRVDGFLSDSQKLILVVEYPLVSLKREFHNRMLNKLQFDKEEITRILYAAIRGYAAVERTGGANTKVRMAHIFVGVQARESTVKVIDSALLSAPTNLQCLILHGSHSSEHYDIYPSPEEFRAYFAKNNLGFAPNSGVFSLGVTLLDLCLMEPSRTAYHFQQEKLEEKEVSNLVKIAGKRHGSNLEKFLLDMLQFDPLKRPSFTQLEAAIPTVFRQSAVGGGSLRLSVVRKDGSQFIENDSKSLRNSRVGSVYSSRSSQGSRVFASSIVVAKPEDEELENIHEEYTNGNQFIGQKKNGLKHGKGKYVFKDRSYYEGGWRNNMMHGRGVLYLPNGKLEYEGEWAEDEPDGWGTYYAYDSPEQSKPWRKYEGQLRRGEMEGRGKLTFANGVIYEGQFRNGKIFGRGRRIEGQGAVVEREWELQSPEDFIKATASSSYKRED